MLEVMAIRRTLFLVGITAKAAQAAAAPRAT
jgi:hypothetical protein